MNFKVRTLDLKHIKKIRPNRQPGDKKSRTLPMQSPAAEVSSTKMAHRELKKETKASIPAKESFKEEWIEVYN
jgi:hypothetical protein